ncbi:PspC domain-containing protein [Candidatus Saccharibacteria bacterium]|nr:PspC domain-containing protein [Candidatus Saccharibacteria bacterium]
MNEIVRIHIAGIPYEIDVDARKKLTKYLDAIKDSLGDASDAMDDIEIRITEILESRGVNKNDVIKLADINAVKEQLGEPKEFSSEEQGKKDKNIADKVRQQFADKKFFRDTENGMVGGVIAGLSAYTGWDITLLRILFVVLVIFTAFFPFLLIYIIVWICAPEAKTASDRLAMKGEPINIETIKEAAEDVADKTTRTVKKGTDKVKSSAPLALRIILGFFGVIGLITFIPFLVALIPVTIISIFTITAATITLKPLFVATAILVAILLFTIASIGITVSTALISAKLSKPAQAGLITSIIFAIALTVASSITGSIWLAQVGRDGAIDTANQLVDGLNIQVEETDHRVKVDIGPIHIDTSK